jgi:hypothetical protein
LSKDISFGCLIGSNKDFYYDKDNNNDISKDSPLGQLIDLISPEKPITFETIKAAYRQSVKIYHPDLNKEISQEALNTFKKINNLYNTVKKFSDLDLPANMRSRSYNIPSNLIGTDIYTRQSLVDKFQAGKIQVLIGTAQTGGMGINLTRAERVIYYSNDYSLINRLQSEDRAHRSGQANKVSYYDIIAKDTIDIGILNILMSKKNVADIITRDNDNLRKMGKGQKI